MDRNFFGMKIEKRTFSDFLFIIGLFFSLLDNTFFFGRISVTIHKPKILFLDKGNSVEFCEIVITCPEESFPFFLSPPPPFLD